MDAFRQNVKNRPNLYMAYTFILNLFIAMIAIGYIMAGQSGRLMISNDFNALVLPNYIFNNQAIKNGDVFWNWNIELGSDFISTFGMKLVNPFFWISFFFDAAQMPYVVGWIFILKYAVAALTAFCYIQRFVKDKRYAIIGATLYAFSGYQSCNTVFYFFHDYVCLFPLLLIALEELIENKKHFFFMFMVAWAALKSVSTFGGEVVFCIIYYIFRFSKRGVKEFWKGVGICFIEGCIGVGLSMVLLLTQLYNTSHVPRATATICGRNGLSLSTADILGYLKAFLLPAESMSQATSMLNSWYSTAVYLPFIGGALVLVYVFDKKDWLSGLLKCSFAMGITPILNSLFMYFSQETYHRWFYMPILMMCLASTRVLERDKEFKISKGYIFIGGMLIVFVLYCMMIPWSVDQKTVITEFKGFIVLIVLGISGYIISYCVIKNIRNPRKKFLLMMIGVTIFSAITTVFTIKQYIDHDHYTSEEAYNSIIMTGVKLKDISKDLDDNYRYDIFDGYYNRSQIAYVMTNYAFESCVHASTFHFYQTLGANRTIQTPVDLPPGTAELLSTKYRVTNKEIDGRLFDASFNNGSEDIYIYTDENALPLGFCYDSYMLQEEFMNLPSEDRAMAMLTALVIDAADEEIVSKVLKKKAIENVIPFTDINLALTLREKSSSVEFEKGTHGFSSLIMSEYPQYAFFSVPYDEKCWSATVNGEPEKIIPVNGLMAVKVGGGENRIEFSYNNIWIRIGMMISGCSMIAMMLYWLLLNKINAGYGRASVIFLPESRKGKIDD